MELGHEGVWEEEGRRGREKMREEGREGRGHSTGE